MDRELFQKHSHRQPHTHGSLHGVLLMGVACFHGGLSFRVKRGEIENVGAQ